PGNRHTRYDTGCLPCRHTLEARAYDHRAVEPLTRWAWEREHSRSAKRSLEPGPRLSRARGDYYGWSCRSRKLPRSPPGWCVADAIEHEPQTAEPGTTGRPAPYAGHCSRVVGSVGRRIRPHRLRYRFPT